jgi:hypothetical protein
MDEGDELFSGYVAGRLVCFLTSYSGYVFPPSKLE